MDTPRYALSFVAGYAAILAKFEEVLKAKLENILNFTDVLKMLVHSLGFQNARNVLKVVNMKMFWNYC